MKLKTLLLTGLGTLAGGMMAQADSVYSVNAVGYVNVTVPQGQFVLMNNPVSQPTNSLNNILPSAPNGTTVWKYSGVGFSSSSKLGASWTQNHILNPGEGFFVKGSSISNVVLTFIGEVPTGTLNINLTPGFNLVASPVPQAGGVQSLLGIPAASGETVWRYNSGSGYTSSTKLGSSWTGGEPQIGVGEGFWFVSNSSKTWTRVFNVNQ